ncbi:GNAT family N-acetyltransferase [Nocardioides sp. L-11A]|uniref:GNAT family N-acetyltransferase n=1 Tax=Nocardioides sp. L-11A TaxID=3043848 RepID=UPI00249A1B2F|nr:GNAT family N-acetyltransferase [Nocardioides sp. L-11A]
MEIHPFGPDDTAALAAWTDLVNAIGAFDAPWERPMTTAIAEARWRHGWDGEPGTPFLARVGEEVVGWAAISTSEYDNLHLAWLELGVHPDHRRQGHGSVLLARLEAEARSAGRTSIAVDAWESEAADGFAKAHGLDRKSAEINRRQVVAEIDWPALDGRYDEALPHAAGYVLERLLGPTPDDGLEALAEMASAINDAPTDDLDYEDEVFSGERMRAYETAVEAHGDRLYRVVARHVATGELAAQTVVAVSRAEPTWGDQHDTSVTRAHRGHRLGLLLKTDMLRWLRDAEPALATIDTWNAESNDRMIEVNEVLAYRVMGRAWAYQRSL